jgi:hypothetical protein
VSYAQLQEVGVEFPASVISELELAGVIIERRYANTRGARRFVGVRLGPSCDPYRTLVGSRAASSVRERIRQADVDSKSAPSVRDRVSPYPIRVMRELGIGAGAAKRWLAATGERLQDCLQPASETCLIYAYALYDLGSALRLHGQPAAAVPVLQRRLQIDNQCPTVQAQLELALRRAS